MATVLVVDDGGGPRLRGPGPTIDRMTNDGISLRRHHPSSDEGIAPVGKPGHVRSRGSAEYHPGMPIYEYRCRACGDTFDELRTLATADAPAACACGGDDTTRLPSLIARGAGSDGLPMAGGGGGGCCGGGGCGCG